jgi:hypothetical protein
MKLKLAVALVALLMSGAANAALTGVQVNGTLKFAGGPTNFFDPANGFVPAGDLNAAGLPVTIGAGTEFGFLDAANHDTADFTDTQLIVGDIVAPDQSAADWIMTFTALTPGAFNGFSLVSDGFTPGLTYGLVGDTITINWAGTGTGDHNFSAIFSFVSGVPEPGTWAMMLLGFGGIGFVMRRDRRRTLAAA